MLDPRRLVARLRHGQARRLRHLWSAEGASLAATLVSGLFVARQLGPEAYGRFALLVTYGGLVFAFLDPRAGEVVTKYFGAATARQDAPSARAVLHGVAALDLCAVLLGTTAVVLLHPVARDLAPGSTGDVALAALSVTLLGPVLTARAVLAVLDRYRAFARLQTAAALLRASAVAAAAAWQADVTAVLAALAGAAAVELALTVALAVAASRQRHGRQMIRPTSLLPAFREAAPGVGRFVAYSEATTFLGSLTKYADTLVVGAVAGTTEAGLYRLARSLTAPVANVVVPLQTITYNRLVLVHATRGRSAMAAVARRATSSALVLAGLLAAASALLPQMVRLTAGDDFAPAGPVAVVLLLGAAVALPLYWLRAWYLVLDRLESWLWTSIAVGLASPAAFVVGAEVAGALGVASARVIVVSVLGNLALLLLLRVKKGSAP